MCRRTKVSVCVSGDLSTAYVPVTGSAERPRNLDHPPRPGKGGDGRRPCSPGSAAAPDTPEVPRPPTRQEPTIFIPSRAGRRPPPFTMLSDLNGYAAPLVANSGGG